MNHISIYVYTDRFYVDLFKTIYVNNLCKKNKCDEYLATIRNLTEEKSVYIFYWINLSVKSLYE